MLDRLIHDLRFALRQIHRHPAFSFLLVATVAVAIGANVAIFSVLEGVILRPLPYPESDRLVTVWNTAPGVRWYQPFSPPDYFDVREQSEMLEDLGVMSSRSFNLAAGVEPVQVEGAICTASIFTLLGVQPTQGRVFTEDEEVDGGHRVLVLSHGFWESQFGGEADVVGRQVNVNGEGWEIIGIMPEGFRFPTPWGGRDGSRLWAPAVLSRDDGDRTEHWLGAIGRLAEGVTPEALESELEAIALQLADVYPDTNARTRMWVQPMMQRTLGGIRTVLIFLLSVVGLVLLVACANVASMLLARGLNRAPEFAIRSSIGAGRRGLIRQLLTESLVLSAVGGVAGVLLAYWGVGVLKVIMPTTVPRAAGIDVNLLALGFAVVVTVATGLVVGLAPSLFASRTNLAEVMKHGRQSRGGGASRNRFLSGLVVAQFAIGFILVNSAVVMAVSYRNVMSQPTNFSTEEVLVTNISLTGPPYETPEARHAFWGELVQRVRSAPGVAYAGVTNKLPLQGGVNGSVLVRDEVFDPEVETLSVEHSFVDEGFHAAMGIPLLAGRLFDQRDMDASAVTSTSENDVLEVPIVINRDMAETLWPESDALGEIVRPRDAEEYYRARVVGIVENVRQWGAEYPPLPEMYFPHTAEVWGPLRGRLIVRAVGDPSALAPTIRQAVHEIDDQIPAAAPFTMATVLRDATARRRFSMLLVALFAATALLLIVTGIYGVVSYSVSQRTHEIGVRMTLGADGPRVACLFLTRAGWILLPGLVVGIGGAYAATTVTRSLVYGISALNPLYMAAAGTVMVFVALAATMVPVGRAACVDPQEALRGE